jgi:hypothetical protein
MKSVNRFMLVVALALPFSGCAEGKSLYLLGVPPVRVYFVHVASNNSVHERPGARQVMGLL